MNKVIKSENGLAAEKNMLQCEVKESLSDTFTFKQWFLEVERY